MLRRKISEVNRIYRELENHTARFISHTEIKCQAGCRACCRFRKVEATVLEFLPAAWTLYRENKLDSVTEKLGNNQDNLCIFYNPFLEAGACSVYGDRGLICRLFGFSAMLDKYNQPSLVSCKYLKTDTDPELLGRKMSEAPVISQYYMKLYGVDPNLATLHYPINTAILKALEYVALHTRFHRPQKAS